MWLPVASGTAESRKALCLGDDFVASRLAVALGTLAGVVRYRVGSVKCIVEAAPARVGGIQGVARIGEGNDELRPANLADFFVDIRCLDLLRRRLRQEIADLFQECGIRIHVERLALVGAMPAVDFRLQGVARLEQFMISGSEIADDGGEPSPESVRGNSGFGRRFLGDEIEQNGGDFQSVGVDTIHVGIFLTRDRGKAQFSGGQRQKRPRKGPCSEPF